MPSKQIKDDIYELLVLAYGLGNQDAWLSLGKEIGEIDSEDMFNTIFKKVAGKDVGQRIDEYIDKDDIPSIQRVIDTEAIRDYNAGVLQAGKRAGAKYKTWETMLDDRVRDTHSYLEGMKVGIDDEFYTYDGDHALHPGGFALPENNCNCRCSIKLEQ